MALQLASPHAWVSVSLAFIRVGNMCLQNAASSFGGRPPGTSGTAEGPGGGGLSRSPIPLPLLTRLDARTKQQSRQQVGWAGKPRAKIQGTAAAWTTHVRPRRPHAAQQPRAGQDTGRQPAPRGHSWHGHKSHSHKHSGKKRRR